MGEQSAKPRRSAAPLVVFGVFVAIFTLLPTLQLILVGLNSGFGSDDFLTRLWAVTLTWLPPVILLAMVVPLVARDNRRLLRIVRIILAIISVAAVAIFVWLAASGKIGGAMLFIGLMMVAVGWSGTLSVEWVMRRASTADEATSRVPEEV